MRITTDLKQSSVPGLSNEVPDLPTTGKIISGKVKTHYAVHMTLQHKGGVTKSFCANVLAQFYQAQDRDVVVLDADPSNKSLAAYKSLNVEPVDIMAPNNTIDAMKFDEIIERIAGEDRDFIVDNGATNFIPFMSYLVSHGAASILAEVGRRLVLHVPIVGGEALNETMSGFDDIAKSFNENVEIVVWMNEAVKGPISFEGKDFETSKAYERHKGKLLALVRVPQHESELFGRDMEKILKNKLTFAEAIERPETRLMSKQRLKQMQRELFEQLSFV